MNTLEIAQNLVRGGFSVIPIGYRSKRPAFDALRWSGCTVETEDGSQPAWEMFKHRAATCDELRLLFSGPRRNLGIVTGYRGLVVLDFDQMDAYEAWASWAIYAAERIGRIVASTYRVFTSRGVHIYLAVDEQVESFKVPGIDVKAQWGYVLAPPSVHPNGHVYYSQGSQVARTARLSDVFPFEKPEPRRPMGGQICYTDDPYEAASRAVECECGASIADIKARVSIEAMVVITSRDSRGAWALCPLHRDTNPSFRVYPDGSWRCFGCEAYGDVIDLYAALHHLTNREAIAALASGQ